MSIREKYEVRSVDTAQTREWILKKHYAKRLPSVMYSFGIFEDKILQGICAFGMPCLEMNDGKCIFKDDYRVITLELQRLVVNDQLPPNTLSYFVSNAMNMLPKPMCLVSYADPHNGHHGYIYQATNWIYSGLSEKGGKMRNFLINGICYHSKSVSKERILKDFGKYDDSKTLSENWIAIGGEIEDFGQKHRYFYFLGNKKQVSEMKKHFRYKIHEYPKGENRRYDSSYKPQVQIPLF